jgi:uncharacterized membrane protein
MALYRLHADGTMRQGAGIAGETVTHPRSDILEWGEKGLIAPGDVRRALELSGALPGAQEWRRFLDRLLLFMGAVLLAAAVVFFFAYNWNDLGRLAKLALVQAPIAVALVLIWRLGLERAAGKAALLFAALLVGALLALVGQVYQTGADTFELFAAWALAIVPWAVVGRFPALWILWLAIVNLAVNLYFNTFPNVFGLVFGTQKQLWVAFAINAAALVIWEAAALGLQWLRERWALRLIATASGVIVTVLAVMDIFDFQHSGWSVAACFAWLGALYAVYRHLVKDLYMLAGGALSLIVLVATLLAKAMRIEDAGALLFIGLVVIGLSAAAGYWLKTVAAAEEA